MTVEIDPTLIRLACGAATAQVYPAVGFNLVDWRVPVGDALVRVIHAEPDVLTGGSGTRSGAPILFPFPNRIADACYDWDGEEYSLPVAHEGDRQAIHGFAAKRPWRMFEATGDNAVTGEFQISRDAPDQRPNWPGDLILRLTYELGSQSLLVTAEVTNPDDRPVPFGLGYHPYFAPLLAATADEAVVGVGARKAWVLDDLIPTGGVVPVAGNNDLRTPVVLGDRTLDDVLTDLDPFVADADGLMERASLTGGAATLRIACDESFRDVVVFTPSNRQSVALEPYTCPTDAVHLQQRGLDVGWRTLEQGQSWRGVVRYSVTAA